VDNLAKRIGGTRRKTRRLFKKNVRQRGKFSIGRYLQKFEPGDKVLLKADPTFQKALYHPRLHGVLGTVQKKRGFCYEVKIKDIKKKKILIIHPVHLVKVD